MIEIRAVVRRKIFSKDLKRWWWIRKVLLYDRDRKVYYWADMSDLSALGSKEALNEVCRLIKASGEKFILSDQVKTVFEKPKWIKPELFRPEKKILVREFESKPRRGVVVLKDLRKK